MTDDITTQQPLEDQVDDVNVQVDLDLDASADTRKKIRPMTIRLGGRTWTLQPPDAGTVFDIEDARGSRAQLALMFDDLWAEAAPYVDAVEDPNELAKLARAYGRHFEIDQDSMIANSAPSRSERRRARKTGRR